MDKLTKDNLMDILATVDAQGFVDNKIDLSVIFEEYIQRFGEDELEEYFESHPDIKKYF